jgi:glycine oxidase
MFDCLILGGGVIGLSLAYELAGHNLRVSVIDRGAPGREASWAGAGILPPATNRPGDPPDLRLAGLSHELHAQWSAELRELTGIDNGYRRCGGIYVARDPEAAGQLDQQMTDWRRRDVRVEPLTAEALHRLEPSLLPEFDDQSNIAACHVPDECQIRNPRHLKALLMACARRGISVEAGVAAEDFQVRGGRIERVITSAGPLQASSVCLACGSWSASLARRLQLTLPVRPVRGQIVLLAGDRPVLSKIITEGSRYLVPRPDGRILIGSTEEEAGFDARPTAEGIAALVDFGRSLVPALGQLPIERSWAGLRPGSADGRPYLGRAAELENLYIATGHFRSGLQLAPATARLVGELIRGEKPSIDLAVFDPQRR